MKARMHLVNPDEAIARIEIEARIGELRQLRQQLVERWPSGELSRILSEVITEAELSFASARESGSGI